MTIILISTSWRQSRHNQPSGRLLVYDVDQNRIIKSCQILEPPYREYDPNPRGGFRGLKGISIADEKIAIANSSTIFIYDKSWHPLAVIWHPICSGIHDIFLQNNQVWVTSTSNDLVFCFDIKGNLIKYIDIRRLDFSEKIILKRIKPFLTEKDIIREKINFRDPRTHDQAITDALHVNSIVILENGDLLISCGLLRIIDKLVFHKINNWLKKSPFSNNYSQIYQLYRKVFNKNKSSIIERIGTSKQGTMSIVFKLKNDLSVENQLMLEKCNVPSHSLRLINEHQSIYLNSASGELIVFNVEDFSILSRVRIGEKFLRGACKLSNGNLVLGDNNSIIHFDMNKKEVLSRTTISEDPAEAVFDIHILPEEYSLPPDSFIEHHKTHFPVNQKIKIKNREKRF